MKERIKRHFLVVASMAILATIILVSIVFYDLYKAQVEKDLEGYAWVLASVNDVNEIDWSDFQIQREDLRVTVVNEAGKVLFDNYVEDVAHMDNHLDREEIKEALHNGEGKSVRISDTLSTSLYYYALLLKDGNVLRVSKEARSMWGVLSRLIPFMLLIMAALFLICIVLANVITKRLITPIEDMAEHINEPDVMPVYPELVPFVKTIKNQHDDILKSAKMRQEFTANVSHELKTPLTSISGYAELMENGMAQGEDIIRFSSAIHKNADRLLTLINDIIRLAELDSSQLSLEFEEIDLYQQALHCMELLKIYAENHDVTMEVEGAPVQIQANRQMIEELIYNLCDNAIRYNNPGGKVVISVYRSKEGSVLSVKDTGIGIPEKHQERVFERFYRVDKSRSKATGGTGLGLAIVKHIAWQHKAKLELNSEPGKGTEIKVTFQ